MTRFHQDILNEPAELLKSLDYTLRDGRPALEEAARILKQSQHIYIIGIGSSWNAGLAVLSFFNAAGRPVMLHDASELLHFGVIPKNAAILFLSRSGKSTEIVQLLNKGGLRRHKNYCDYQYPGQSASLGIRRRTQHDGGFRSRCLGLYVFCDGPDRRPVSLRD